MTLNCSADNCVYNNSGICYAGSIKVNGVDASTTTGTTCATYTPKNNENSRTTIQAIHLQHLLI